MHKVGRINLPTILLVFLMSFSLFVPANVLAVNVVSNLELSATTVAAEGDLIAFRLSEFEQGSVDLNGDGDVFDEVVHVLNTNTGVLTNLARASTDTPKIQGTLVIFSVAEFAQNKDLNGDGDMFDSVVHVFDESSGVVTNSGISGFFPQFVGNSIIFRVGESSEGNTDLNGDGDMFDSVVHVFDPLLGITNLGFASSGINTKGDIAVIRVSESQQGNIDINGDGDTFDNIPFVFDESDGTTTSLSPSQDFALIVDRFVYADILETVAGVDLNGDLDTTDAVLHVYDAGTKTFTNLGLAAGNKVAGDNALVFMVSEVAQGNTDLNSDLDVGDPVAHVAVGTSVTNTGLATAFPAFAGDFVFLGVSEFLQGGIDRNGDGDAFDTVLALFDPNTSTATNLMLAGFPFPQKSKIFAAFAVSEFEQGGIDRNGDGNADDTVQHVVDLATKSTTNLGFATFGSIPEIDGNLLSFVVPEGVFNGQNQDLNGDGDKNDFIEFAFEFSTSTTVNSGLDFNNPIVIHPDLNVFSFFVRESTFGADLNGDSDTLDIILHVFDGNTLAFTNLGLAALPPVPDTDIMAFQVFESQQSQDLNNDLDFTDRVLHTFGKFVEITSVITPMETDVDALVDLINSLAGLDHGTISSLLAPLSNIDKLNDDDNTNNDSAICGKLDAFIKQVNAKEGKKLTPAEASSLRQLAEDIKIEIGCA